MTRLAWLALGAAAVALSGCDAVRYPGDGGEPPETPRSRPADGPPGPPPPERPVDTRGDADPGDATGAPDTGSSGGQSGDQSGGQSDDQSHDQTDTSSDQTGAAPDEGPGAGEETETDAPVDETRGDTGDETGTDTGGATPGAPATDAAPAPEPVFRYYAPGQLAPGSGTGAPEQIVHVPDMVFPIRSAPAYPQSMVWNFGGGVKGGDECDPRNFEDPWRDNFCETRSSDRNTPYCPRNRVHQGQDIRVGTPEECRILRNTPPDERTLHEVVAVEDGVIYDIATYTVKLRAGGRIYRYMHLNMDRLQVAEGDQVKAGDVIGYVSKDFGGTPTTFHLHFEILQNTQSDGWVHVPPYLSLVEAYERREGGPGEEVEPPVTVASDVPAIPPDFEIIE